MKLTLVILTQTKILSTFTGAFVAIIVTNIFKLIFTHITFGSKAHVFDEYARARPYPEGAGTGTGSKPAQRRIKYLLSLNIIRACLWFSLPLDSIDIFSSYLTYHVYGIVGTTWHAKQVSRRVLEPTRVTEKSSSYLEQLL